MGLGLALLLGLPAPAHAFVLETDRLWTIGASAFEDGLYDQAYRALGQFLALGLHDARRGDAAIIRGKAALALGRVDDALGLFQLAEALPTQVVPTGEVLFWEAEALFRLSRFGEARERYGRFLASAPASPYAPDALFGRAQCELQLDQAAAAHKALEEHYLGKLALRLR